MTSPRERVVGARHGRLCVGGVREKVELGQLYGWTQGWKMTRRALTPHMSVCVHVRGWTGAMPARYFRHKVKEA